MRWYAWWPLVVAIAATPFAVREAEILPLMGVDGLHRLCLLVPFAMLAQQHQLGLQAYSQMLMYAQFPIYGVLLVLMQRVQTFAAGVIAVATLHLAGAAGAWILADHILEHVRF